MITINSNEEALALIKDGVLAVNDDIEIAFDGFEIYADIKCKNIYSKDRVRGIKACNINAGDINAGDINARNINSCNINAGDINSCNINAGDINAWNINTGDIDAKNISYYAICVAYGNINCTSIKGRRQNSKHFCLDGKITIIEEQNHENISTT